MLNANDNVRLTRAGSGTPMGEYLRRYWHPVALSRELPEPDGTPLRVEIMGEQLVAFRDSDGRVGLFDRRCPHRGADLFFGRNEECGLREPTLRCADETLQIPLYGRKNSLNVACAFAIVAAQISDQLRSS